MKLASTNTAARRPSLTALFTTTGSTPWVFHTFQLPFTWIQPPILAKISRLKGTAMVVAALVGVFSASMGGVDAMNHMTMAQTVAIFEAYCLPYTTGTVRIPAARSASTSLQSMRISRPNIPQNRTADSLHKDGTRKICMVVASL